MPATLTATKNPVGVWGETASGTTNITWNTGSAARGRVYLSISTGVSFPLTETLFDGDPDPKKCASNGSKPLTVQFGSSYKLVLRQVTNNAALATLIVTVEDLVQQELARVAASAVLMARFNQPQSIYDLSIRPGIDTARVSFKTVQPTIPTLRVEAPDGTVTASWFPLFGGLQTKHQALLGQTTPLPQATSFKVTITASGHNFLGRPHDAVVTSHFTTGSRHAMIDFEKIDMRKDGDPLGAGEFTFLFGAGDAEDRSDLSKPWPEYRNDISDDDPPVFIRKQISIPLAPRNLWIGAIGQDDDSSIFNPGFLGLGPVPRAGTGWTTTDVAEQSWITQVFDISEVGDGKIIPMSLATGDFGVAFTVSGRITVNTTAGFSQPSLSFSNITQRAKSVSVLAGAGSKAWLVPEQNNGRGHVGGYVLGRDAAGAVYHRILNADRRLGRDEDWMLATPAVAGPVTAVAPAQDRLAFFALDSGGAVLRADVVGVLSASEWRSLGGRFTGAFTAVTQAESIELLAHDDAGTAFHLTLAGHNGDPASDWRQIGDGVQGDLVAVPLDKDAFGVFALGRNGEVMYRFHQNGRWQAEGWQTIAGATGVLLGADCAGGQSLALAVIDKDLKLHTLLWRDYPKTPPGSWTSHGDLQSWLVRPLQSPQRITAGSEPVFEIEPKAEVPTT